MSDYFFPSSMKNFFNRIQRGFNKITKFFLDDEEKYSENNLSLNEGYDITGVSLNQYEPSIISHQVKNKFKEENKSQNGFKAMQAKNNVKSFHFNKQDNKSNLSGSISSVDQYVKLPEANSNGFSMQNNKKKKTSSDNEDDLNMVSDSKEDEHDGNNKSIFLNKKRNNYFNSYNNFENKPKNNLSKISEVNEHSKKNLKKEENTLDSSIYNINNNSKSHISFSNNVSNTSSNIKSIKSIVDIKKELDAKKEKNKKFFEEIRKKEMELDHNEIEERKRIINLYSTMKNNLNNKNLNYNYTKENSNFSINSKKKILMELTESASLVTKKEIYNNSLNLFPTKLSESDVVLKSPNKDASNTLIKENIGLFKVKELEPEIKDKPSSSSFNLFNKKDDSTPKNNGVTNVTTKSLFADNSFSSSYNNSMLTFKKEDKKDSPSSKKVSLFNTSNESKPLLNETNSNNEFLFKEKNDKRMSFSETKDAVEDKNNLVLKDNIEKKDNKIINTLFGVKEKENESLILNPDKKSLFSWGKSEEETKKELSFKYDATKGFGSEDYLKTKCHNTSIEKKNETNKSEVINLLESSDDAIDNFKNKEITDKGLFNFNKPQEEKKFNIVFKNDNKLIDNKNESLFSNSATTLKPNASLFQIAEKQENISDLNPSTNKELKTSNDGPLINVTSNDTPTGKICLKDKFGIKIPEASETNSASNTSALSPHSFISPIPLAKTPHFNKADDNAPTLEAKSINFTNNTINNHGTSSLFSNTNTELTPQANSLFQNKNLTSFDSINKKEDSKTINIEVNKDNTDCLYKKADNPFIWNNSTIGAASNKNNLFSSVPQVNQSSNYMNNNNTIFNAFATNNNSNLSLNTIQNEAKSNPFETPSNKRSQRGGDSIANISKFPTYDTGNQIMGNQGTTTNSLFSSQNNQNNFSCSNNLGATNFGGGMMMDNNPSSSNNSNNFSKPSGSLFENKNNNNSLWGNNSTSIQTGFPVTPSNNSNSSLIFSGNANSTNNPNSMGNNLFSNYNALNNPNLVNTNPQLQNSNLFNLNETGNGGSLFGNSSVRFLK